MGIRGVYDDDDGDDDEWMGVSLYVALVGVDGAVFVLF